VIADAVTRILSLVGARAPGTIRVMADPDAALLASSAALRRLGARITRYDVDAGTLEARQDGVTLRLTAAAEAPGRSRLALETDPPAARRLVRRFRSELAHGASAGSA
jgi:hypothetical protein